MLSIDNKGEATSSKSDLSLASSSPSSSIESSSKENRTYSIFVTVDNGTYIGEHSIKEDEIKEITIIPNEDYVLPDSISVRNADYEYIKESGKIVLSSPRSNITINVTCKEKPETYQVKKVPKPSKEELKTLDFTKGNYVFACDYHDKTQVVLYDLDYYQNNLEECEIWTLDPIHVNPLSGSTIQSCICAKLRNTPQYGLVCMVGTGDGYVSLYSFPEGERLVTYYMREPNLHSAEMLPNGAIVSAGINDDYLRLINPGETSIKSEDKYIYYHGSLGHSVIYDSKENKLYSAGGSYIRRWDVIIDEDNKASLTLERTYEGGLNDPHDITFDPFDDNIIYVTDNGAQYKFYKDSFKLENIGYISQCKAYGYNALGTLIYNYAEYSYLTSTISAKYQGYKFVRSMRSTFREFYKTSPVNVAYMFTPDE